MKVGKLPRNRHTRFYDESGRLLREELFGTESFDGIYSLLYHYYEPTAVLGYSEATEWSRDEWKLPTYRHHHLRTRLLNSGGDFLDARRLLAFNDDVAIYFLNPDRASERLFRNASGDELYFVHKGEVKLTSVFGLNTARESNYLYIPRGTTYNMSTAENTQCLLIESNGPLRLPQRYLNRSGQLTENAPFYTRDIRPPEGPVFFKDTHETDVTIKLAGRTVDYTLSHNPFDVVGWDGYLYPYSLDTQDIAPLTGKLHQPPTVHETFTGTGFMVGTFVPRKLDYHPMAVPVPYYHSNIDSDELIFYSRGTFMSRKGVEEGSITLHKRGVHHGPQPGVVEASFGKDETDELAVMVETYRPLLLGEAAQRIDDSSYPLSWGRQD
ncbi:MAG: homogentisate 1,2-dioxygenase [Thermoprotei archaeon]